MSDTTNLTNPEHVLTRAEVVHLAERAAHISVKLAPSSVVLALADGASGAEALSLLGDDSWACPVPEALLDTEHGDLWAEAYWEELGEAARQELDPADRVQLGAAMLDAVSPGWEHALDLDHLLMSSCHSCVLGQVYGEYWDGADELGLDGGGEVPVQLGFLSPSSPVISYHRSGTIVTEDYEALAESWRALVRARLELDHAGPA